MEEFPEDLLLGDIQVPVEDQAGILRKKPEKIVCLVGVRVVEDDGVRLKVVEDFSELFSEGQGDGL